MNEMSKQADCFRQMNDEKYDGGKDIKNLDDCACELDRLKTLLKEKDGQLGELIEENECMCEAALESKKRLNDLDKKVQQLDDDTRYMEEGMRESIGLIQDIGDVARENDKLKGKVDDLKANDLMKQLEDCLKKKEQCEQANNTLKSALRDLGVDPDNLSNDAKKKLDDQKKAAEDAKRAAEEAKKAQDAAAAAAKAGAKPDDSGKPGAGDSGARKSGADSGAGKPGADSAAGKSGADSAAGKTGADSAAGKPGAGTADAGKSGDSAAGKSGAGAGDSAAGKSGAAAGDSAAGKPGGAGGDKQGADGTAQGKKGGGGADGRGSKSAGKKDKRGEGSKLDDTTEEQFEEFVKNTAKTLSAGEIDGVSLERELRKILDMFIDECGFCFCKCNIPKSRFYAICHKLYHHGLHTLDFKDLAYMHKRIFAAAENILPGCLFNMIMKDIMSCNPQSLVPSTAVQKKQCCTCKSSLCCDDTEDKLMLKGSFYFHVYVPLSFFAVSYCFSNAS